ncbi:hybrid sensor histidine kinase/response regulator [Aspergillus undulatus]|uniref:hybrid sensor histidine kinase/response regulator n=1 Tax=Aspergillus undulatus TaxID=1810928 RepID=UPI003CCD2201
MSAAGETAIGMGEYLPPLVDAEKQRLREVSRFVSSVNTQYYDSIRQSSFAETSTSATATPTPGENETNIAQLSNDITLTALTQLAMESPPLEKTGCGTNSPQGTSFTLGRSSTMSTPLLTAKDSVPLTSRIANVFAHASSLVKDAMDVDGVMFVDACWCNSGIVRPRTGLHDWEPLPKNADPRPRSQSPYSPTHSPTQADNTVCDIFGLAGGILHPDEDSTDQEIRLAKFFPQARSLLFIPLWDWNKGQWLAGTFVWTRDSEQERSLGLDEVHYFKVFSDSIISEIAQLNWSQKEKSKFDLISSVSHELRSPLHGMLANAELLSTSTLQPDQLETVKALETCGITLLDTMNHLLDFAKINNLTSLNQGASSVTSLVSSFDLDLLVEEAVHSVFSGMRHASIASTPTSSPKSISTYKGDLSVVVRFENQDQWRVTSMTGAWRRIVMNILGNALKYTENGFVEVSASLLKPQHGSDSPIAHLRFADSGRGMSEDFLRNKLFSPFSQEDALSEGAGLGLSIVKQLITFLKGSIDVKSEIDVGTQVDIYIPVQPVAAPALITQQSEVTATTTFSLVGLGAYPELSEEPTGTLSPAAKRKICLQSFSANLISDQPGWKVLSAESLDQAHGDIVVIDETALKQIYDEEALRRKFTNTRFVCLCDGVPTLNTTGEAQVARLYQPFSPRKVLQVLKSALEAKPQFPAPAPAEQPVLNLSLTTTVSATPVTPNLVDPARSDSSHVLIVDDNEINIKVLSKLMSKLDYQYRTATNGQIALNKYKESPEAFKIILMDVSMPVMDGIEATRHIRVFEQERSLSPVKVFAVTGIASAAMQKEAMMAGVDDYLVKPLSLAQLGKLIKVHL